MNLANDPLLNNFRSPPETTGPWTYWHWVSGHISREGITRDLELMAELGLTEACIGNVDITPDTPGPVQVLSEAWWELCAFAVAEGKRLGVHVSSFNGPGWSQSGGPWVEPKHAMKFMQVSETPVVSEGRIDLQLNQPEGYFEDVATLAVPGASVKSLTFDRVSAAPEDVDVRSLLQPGSEQDILIHSPDKDTPIQLTFVRGTSVTVRSVTFIPGRTAFKARAVLWAGDDAGSASRIGEWQLDRSSDMKAVGPFPWAPVCLRIPETCAAYFRVDLYPMATNFDYAENPAAGGVLCLREVVFSEEARLERYMEKQLAKLHQAPVVPWDAYMWPEQDECESGATPPDAVLDLTDKLDGEGRLQAELAPGAWTLLRVVAVPTETTNSPASPEATGLEIDKMSRDALAVHIDHYIDELSRRVPEAHRDVMRHIIADSFETGSQNWTEGMREIFQETYGYDLRPWLPVLTGRIVGSARESDAFLWDLRRLVADRIASEYVGGMRDLAEARGQKLWIENYGHWGYPAEFLQYGGASHEIAGEFWTYDALVGNYWMEETLGDDEVYAAACASHIYGKNVVSAEAFTAAGSIYKRDPWALKTRGDWAQTLGINHFLLHVWVHQPNPERLPGVTTWYGTEFNAHTPWMPHARCWVDYFRRCHALLQAGRHVADVVYFIGEDAPKMAGIQEPGLPEGYDFDYINGEMLHRFEVAEDGWLTLPGGARYRVLVLPPQNTMRPCLLRKIAELVEAGALVVGPKPVRSPSLENQPAADAEVAELANRLWPDDIEPFQGCGKGRVYRPSGLGPILQEHGLLPALDGAGELLWIQRETEEGDRIFFISNQSDDAVASTLRFRSDADAAELWHPVDGRLASLDSMCIGGQHEIELRFAPREAYFVIFRQKPSSELTAAPAFMECRCLRALEGPWGLDFDPKFGGPEETVRIDQLIDWREHENPAIQHYSGHCRYSIRFTLSEAECAEARFIELTDYANLAAVTVNGVRLGEVWTRPGRLPLKALQVGENELQIDIYTSWNNRVFAESKMPEEERVLQVDGKLQWRDSPWSTKGNQPAGLMGQVVLLA